MERNDGWKKTKTFLITAIIMIIIISIIFGANPIKAALIEVDVGDVLQDEIDNASNGDVIQINVDQTLSSNIIINKSLTLRGEESTIVIDGSGNYGLNVTEDEVTIQNLTFEDCSTAIYLQNVNDSAILFNNITQSDLAINITDNSTSNQIISNIFYQNDIAMNITSSSGNSIFYNIFIDSTTRHVSDNGTNTWNTSVKGNYWDDYTDEDENEDGIGDSSYEIDNGDNQDDKPLISRTPTADFSYTSDSVSIDDSIEFTSTSVYPNNVGLTYSWDFDDGDTSTSRIVTHSFSDEGTYNITLTVTNTHGSDLAYQTIEITNDTPIIECEISPDLGIVNESISFNVDITDDGSIEEYNWDFDDGDTSTNQNPTHIYSNSGSYNVSLTVEDDDGNIGEFSTTITVTYIPSVNITYAPHSPTTNETITFTDGSTDKDSTIVSRSWDFGDGNTSTSQNPTHFYWHNGTYTVTLSVTDSHGATNDTTRSIIVYNSPPIANFSYSPKKPSTHDKVTFDDGSIDTDGTIVNWTWTFDGVTNYSKNVTYQFKDSGKYLVTLNVTDNQGDTNETSIYIVIENRISAAVWAGIIIGFFFLLIILWFVAIQTDIISEILKKMRSNDIKDFSKPVRTSQGLIKDIVTIFHDSIISMNSIVFGLNEDPWEKMKNELNHSLYNIDLFTEKPDVYVGIQERLTTEEDNSKKILKLIKNNNGDLPTIINKTKLSKDDISKELSTLLKYGLIHETNTNVFKLTTQAERIIK